MKVKYFIVHILSIFFIAIALAVFNAVTDPYNIFFDESPFDFNKKKLTDYKKMLLTAHFRAKNTSPDAIIFSDSLGYYGFDKETFSQYKNPYNASLPGTILYISYRLNQEFPNIKRDKPVVYIVLNYANSESSDRRIRSSEFVKRFERRLKQKRNGDFNPAYYFYYSIDFLVLLFTWESTIDSFNTIIRQDRNYLFQDSGFLYNQPKQNVSMELSQSEDPYHDFNIPEFNIEKDISENHFEFKNYRALLADIYENGQQAYIIIAPRSVLFFEGLFKKNQQHSFINWKRHLLRINTELSGHFLVKPFELWDFSGYTPATYDQFQLDGTIEKTSHYYMDTIHFNTTLGELIIQRILNPDIIDPEILKMGTQLTPDNFDDIEENFYRGHQEFGVLFRDYLSQY